MADIPLENLNRKGRKNLMIKTKAQEKFLLKKAKKFAKKMKQ